MPVQDVVLLLQLASQTYRVARKSVGCDFPNETLNRLCCDSSGQGDKSPCTSEGGLLEPSYPSAPFSPLIRCRLSLRQPFAPFIALAELSIRQGSKGSRARGNGPGEAEARVVAAVVGPVVARGRPAEVSAVEPTAAANHAVGASRFIDPSRAVIRSFLVSLVPVVLHPLPDVAVHVVKTPVVGLLFAHRMSSIF